MFRVTPVTDSICVQGKGPSYITGGRAIVCPCIQELANFLSIFCSIFFSKKTTDKYCFGSPWIKTVFGWNFFLSIFNIASFTMGVILRDENFHQTKTWMQKPTKYWKCKNVHIYCTYMYVDSLIWFLWQIINTLVDSRQRWLWLVTATIYVGVKYLGS